MPVPTTPQVIYAVRDRVAWIHLNRPEAMNALGPEIARGIADAVEEAGNDDNVLCIVLIGEGGRAFSAGMDLKAMTAADSGGPAITAGPGDVFNALAACPKVTIAAIDGYCLAGGMQTASRCDMRIATKKSKFGMPEARRALAAVGTEDTPELFVPAGEAAWILLTGAHMPAERAYQVGYVQQLVEDRDELVKAAEALAGEVKQCAPLALRYIKAVIRAQYNLPTPAEGVKRLDHVKALTAELGKRNNESEDRLEGPKAFAEKRAPVWKNR